MPDTMLPSLVGVALRIPGEERGLSRLVMVVMVGDFDSILFIVQYDVSYGTLLCCVKMACMRWCFIGGNKLTRSIAVQIAFRFYFFSLFESRESFARS